MADLFDTPPIGPPPQRRGARLSANGRPIGRPPGAKGKRASDLARYIEATFGGMTPGQQSAELALVKPKDLAKAKAMAKEFGLVDLGLSPLMLAQVVKAAQLAAALGCDRQDAWAMLAAERSRLMEYVHQKQPVAAPKKTDNLPTLYVVSELDMEQAALAPPVSAEELEMLEDFDLPQIEVSRPKSHDAT